jgi:predicted ArsR family transcriptional regulator
MPEAPPKRLKAPYLTRPELLSILRHPTRVHCIGVLSERPASVKELAAELGEEEQNVRYHINQLKKVSLVKLDRTARDAGDGRVLFYRATKRAWFDRETWEQIPTPNGVTAAIMGLVNQDIAQAIMASTFDGKTNHISRTPAILDPESYEELISLLTDTLEGIFAIKTLAEDRIEEDTETISTVVNIIHFDLPPTGPAD